MALRHQQTDISKHRLKQGKYGTNLQRHFFE